MLSPTKSRTLIVESSLERFRKLAAISVLCLITVHAEDLKTWRIPLIAQPLVEPMAAKSTNSPAVFMPVIIDMIER